MSKLTNGRIPAGQVCPFLSRCGKGTGECMVGHKGEEHKVAFSCALARGYDLIESSEETENENG